MANSPLPASHFNATRAGRSDAPRFERSVHADIVLLPERCYRCHQITAPVVGLWFEHGIVNGHRYETLEEWSGPFLPYDEFNADAIATVCSDETLEQHGAGPLRWRTTRMCPDGYLANTCVHCGAVLGNWPLHEALTEFQSVGGTPDELPRIRVAFLEDPLALL